MFRNAFAHRSEPANHGGRRWLSQRHQPGADILIGLGGFALGLLAAWALPKAGRADLIDTQYFLFNLLALGYFFATLIPSLSHGLPQIPELLFGLTSAAALTYVTKKAVEKSVPAVTSVVPQTARPGAHRNVWGKNLTGADGSAPGFQIGGHDARPVEVLTDAPRGTNHLRVQVPEDDCERRVQARGGAPDRHQGRARARVASGRHESRHYRLGIRYPHERKQGNAGR